MIDFFVIWQKNLFSSLMMSIGFEYDWVIPWKYLQITLPKYTLHCSSCSLRDLFIQCKWKNQKYNVNEKEKTILKKSIIYTIIIIIISFHLGFLLMTTICIVKWIKLLELFAMRVIFFSKFVYSEDLT